MSDDPTATTDQRGNSSRRSRKRKALKAATLAVALEAAVMRVRGYRFGTDVIVRCRAGHLFSTIWIPGASVKSLRFGLKRLQYCPVGHHWSIVTPVKSHELTDEDRRLAGEHRDIRVP